MTGPKLEDGYTRIANELFEAILRSPFGKIELKIIFIVIRKTYGYQKKMDMISLSQLSDMAGIEKANISRFVNNLIKNKVLISTKTKNSRMLELNKLYTEWMHPKVVKTTTQRLLKQQPLAIDKGCQNNNPKVVKTTTTGCQNNNERVVKTTTTKDKRNSKEKKETQKVFFDQFWSAYPKKVGRKKVFEKWLKIDPDKKLLEKILRAIETVKIFKWNHTESQYIPNALTWLNQERWDDEPIDERSNQNATSGRYSQKGFERGDEIGQEWLDETITELEQKFN